MSLSAHYAHTKGTVGPEGWQRLDEHLRSVAGQARSFCAPWGAGEWARLAGLWHDLGKYQPDFQNMLFEVQRGERKRLVDHSSAGAIHSAERFRRLLAGISNPGALEYLELLLTAPIAGHHAGLPETREALRARLESRRESYERAIEEAPTVDVLQGQLPAPPARLLQEAPRERRLRCEFLVRMIFSALVDADRLDTARDQESEVPPDLRPSTLRSSYSSVSVLSRAVDASIDQRVASLDREHMGALEAEVFRYRQEVLTACRDAAEWAPGVFTLDVATGGGKTLASLSFALRHAQRHGKQRVIVVIPFTSIIEQTAVVYRDALGRDLAPNLLEHHSAAEEDDDRGEQDPGHLRRRLATENWDVPIVVTTGVQFFESMFARTTSRCRKLHNIANSVVVLDEAQTLPPELLNPTVWALNELAEGYGTTVVLATATQPSLEKPFPELRNARAIVGADVESPPERVRVEIVGEEPVTWPQLAAELSRPANERVLCITHRRADARDLTLALDAELGSQTALHLSATMCAVHRAERIREINQLLAHRAPCRVVSTQLVEAGVDLDFPVVYRALGGIDSLVQAAGRANREGRLGVHGGVLRVYRPPSQPPPGLPRKGASVTNAMLRSAAMDGEALDLFEPSVVRRFFRRYFDSISDLDRGITALREEFRFAEVAAAYRFIDDATVPVVVPYAAEVDELVREARQAAFPGGALRRLQPFTVGVYAKQLDDLRAAGSVEELLPDEGAPSGSAFVLVRGAIYSARFGLDLSGNAQVTPEDLIQ